MTIQGTGLGGLPTPPDRYERSDAAQMRSIVERNFRQLNARLRASVIAADEDETITGQWAFDQTIVGDISGDADTVDGEHGSFYQDAGNLVSGTLADARVAQSNVTQHQGAIDHDSLQNFVANEHVDHSSVSISGGTGLSGGGDITSSRTLSVDNYSDLARLGLDETITGTWSFPAATVLDTRAVSEVVGQVEAGPQNLLSQDAGPEFSWTGQFGFADEVDIPIDDMELEVGDVISVSGGIRSETGADDVYLILRFRDSSQSNIAQVIIGPVNSATPTRVRHGEEEIPDNTAYIAVFGRNDNETETAYCQRRMLNKGPIAESFVQPPLRTQRKESAEFSDVIVGTDPGGSELLRVGGSVAVSGTVDGVDVSSVGELDQNETITGVWDVAADTGATGVNGNGAVRNIIHHGSSSPSSVGFDGTLHTQDI